MSSRSSEAGLLGSEVQVAIAEPWDFTSEAGDNLLVGRIRAISAERETPEWALCAVSTFSAGGRRVTSVAAVQRYAQAPDLLRRLSQGESVGVNLLYDPVGRALEPASVRAALQTQGGLQFLAGSMRLTDADPDRAQG